MFGLGASKIRSGFFELKFWNGANMGANPIHFQSVLTGYYSGCAKVEDGFALGIN